MATTLVYKNGILGRVCILLTTVESVILNTNHYVLHVVLDSLQVSFTDG